MKMSNIKGFVVAAVVFGSASGLLADYPIRSAAMTKTRVTRGFWFDRLETNRTATLKSNWAKCNETPSIAPKAVKPPFVKSGGVA